MQQFDSIHISDYDYPLPENRIAQYPLSQRDQSKLLVAQKEQLTETVFDQIDTFLPKNSLLVFNDTKVVRARMHFHKSSGARLEIFILEPLIPTTEIQNAFQVTQSCHWKCLVGGAKKWKEGSLVLHTLCEGKDVEIKAEKIQSFGDSYEIRFSWAPSQLSFSQIIESAGSIPLPPYMQRKSEPSDQIRYQTIYAQHEGSVAAPTAGLHFTETIFEKLKAKNIAQASISLHVGAGTFKPVSAESITDHSMHHEQIVISQKLVQQLIHNQGNPLIAVGTTSTRSLESLYWFGARLIQNPEATFDIQQWEPYLGQPQPTALESLNAVLHYMQRHQLHHLHGSTGIIIAPGYQFQLVDVLITNFHQPKSTLLLLVSAFYGNHWMQAYQFALDHQFRFLSYGDACLFYINRST